jgi:hypothetical protein
MDIFLAGYTNVPAYPSVQGDSYSPVAQLWRNTSAGIFTHTNVLPAEGGAPGAWADFNNDGRLDLLILNWTNSPSGGPQLLENVLPTANTPPSPPTGLAATRNGTAVRLSWDAGSDSETPSAGLTYNVRVGTSAGACDVLSPLADPNTGWRRIPQMGNAQKRLFLMLTNLSYGSNYYWSVQSIDNAMAGGAFAAETNFTIPFIPPDAMTWFVSSPSPAAAAFQGKVNPHTAPTAVWFQYGLDTNYGSVTPATNLTGPLTQLVTILISNLTSETFYHCRVVASNVAGISYGEDASLWTPPYARALVGTLGVGSKQVWGDYDNDGWLDCLIVGPGTNGPVAQVWRNLGNGTFTDIGAGLTGMIGDADWVDYDNDGWLDIFISGNTGSNYVSQIWRNMRDGTFSNINVTLPTTYGGLSAWGDYDNDGYPDLLTVGYDGSYTCRICRNQHDGTFSTVDAGLPPVTDGSIVWADFDGDGWQDVLLTGASPNTGFALVAQIWRNQGDGTFSNTVSGLPPIVGAAVVADFDGDGSPDIALAGSTNGGTFPTYRTEVWRNLGDGTFTNINAGLPRGYTVASAADQDNNGRPDLLLTANQVYSSTDLYRNDGNGTFTGINNVGIISLEGAGTVTWGDYDRDGRLDLFVAGYIGYGAGTTNVCLLWRNYCSVSNQPPSAPANLMAQSSANDVILRWTAAVDAETPSTGLSYNVRMGTTPGGVDVFSPLSEPGHRFAARRSTWQCTATALRPNHSFNT